MRPPVDGPARRRRRAGPSMRWVRARPTLEACPRRSTRPSSSTSRPWRSAGRLAPAVRPDVPRREGRSAAAARRRRRRRHPERHRGQRRGPRARSCRRHEREPSGPPAPRRAPGRRRGPGAARRRRAYPVGEIVRGSTLANGLQIRQVRVPMGVIGMIYEARPNVHRRRGRARPEVRQRRDPARRLRSGQQQPRARRDDAPIADRGSRSTRSPCSRRVGMTPSWVHDRPWVRRPRHNAKTQRPSVCNAACSPPCTVTWPPTSCRRR